MPDTDRERPKATRFARLRFALGAAFLAATGLLVWFRPRRPAVLPEQRERRERIALIARLRRSGHEPNDVQVAPIFAVALLVILLAISLHLALWVFFRASLRPEPTPAAAFAPMNAPVQRPAGLPTATVAPLPDRLPVRPEDQQQLQAQEEQRLHSYGWVDQGQGIVHIPIDAAIDLIVERGLPTRGGR